MNPLPPLQQFLGRGVCTTRRSSPAGTGREDLTESSWDRAELGNRREKVSLGRITDVSRTCAFGWSGQ